MGAHSSQKEQHPPVPAQEPPGSAGSTLSLGEQQWEGLEGTGQEPRPGLAALGEGRLPSVLLKAPPSSSYFNRRTHIFLHSAVPLPPHMKISWLQEGDGGNKRNCRKRDGTVKNTLKQWGNL